jgi:hypothetical protein
MRGVLSTNDIEEEANILGFKGLQRLTSLEMRKPNALSDVLQCPYPVQC